MCWNRGRACCMRMTASGSLTSRLDGVTRALSWVDIEKALDQGGTPEEMARHITDAVDESTAEDKDNASVLLYMN